MDLYIKRFLRKHNNIYMTLLVFLLFNETIAFSVVNGTDIHL